MDEKAAPPVLEKEAQQGAPLLLVASGRPSQEASSDVETAAAEASPDDENDTVESHGKSTGQEDQAETVGMPRSPSTSMREKRLFGKDDEQLPGNKIPIMNSKDNNNHDRNENSETDHGPPKERDNVSVSFASIDDGSDSESVSFEAVKRQYEKEVLKVAPDTTSSAPDGGYSNSSLTLSVSSGREESQQQAPSSPGPQSSKRLDSSGRNSTGARHSLPDRSPGRGREAPTRIPRSVRTSLRSNLPTLPGSPHLASMDDSRRSSFRAAKSERIFYKPDDSDAESDNPSGDPLPAKGFKKKARSLSMDLGTKVKEQEAARATLKGRSSDHMFQTNRYSVMFGASREQSHYQPKVIRKSRSCDVQTGGQTEREVVAQRIVDYPQAMNPAERRRKMVVRTGHDDFERKSMHGGYDELQYRIQSKLLSSITFKEQLQSQSVQPGFLTTYLTWSLRAPFPIVLLSEALAFWGLVCVFATCIYLGAFFQPQCIQMLGVNHRYNFEEGGTHFLDAFSLSWTTFSTVGYGIVHPQVRREPEEKSFNCAFMTALVSLESFVGVIFASFCGAVIVGKISRAKSAASVRFSQRMIIRFGTGVMYTDDDDDRCNDEKEMPLAELEKERSKFPPPVLEFRIANCLFHIGNGEIINSKVSVVGSTILEKEADSRGMATTVITSVMGVTANLNMLKGMKESASKASNFIRKPFNRAMDSLSQRDDSSLNGGGFRRSSLPLPSKTDLANDRDSDHEPTENKVRVLRRISIIGHEAIEKALLKKRIMRRPPRTPSMDQLVPPKAEKQRRKTAICVEEDPTGGLAPKKLFYSLKIDCDNHPFFNRVWTIRHVLDADSPLLSEKARRMVRECRGLWSAEACQAEYIRKNVNFQQLIVSFSGTSNVNGSDVYGLNVYDYKNLHVGYTFAPILQPAADGKLEVDLDDIDNIRIQRGGGAEAIDYYEMNLHYDNSETSKKMNDILDQKRAQFLRKNSKSSSIEEVPSEFYDSSDDVDDSEDLLVRRVSYHSVLRTTTR